MSTEPQPHVTDLPPAAEPALAVVPPRPDRSLWRQPRDAEGRYVDVARRDLASLTSLRFFAAAYVLVHHLINMSLLALHGDGADRDATWLLAWGTQGHVGVTFFFVLSGFILAWCYHRAFATAPDAELRGRRRRFWVARIARVWPLHAAMFCLFVPLALRDAGGSIGALAETAATGLANLLLLHAWWPFGGADGIADTFNAPSWTLSVEACFYLLFPLIAVLLLRRLRWGIAQLTMLAAGSWIALGVLGAAIASHDRADWIMRVLPLTRLVDFVVGVTVGLVFVQLIQRRKLDGADEQPAAAPSRWFTALEAGLVLLACTMPLLWARGAVELLPATLGTSWFYLPVMAGLILVMAGERGAISRRLLAARPLVWLGEISYALYLVHMFILLAAFQAGLFDRLGVVATCALVVAASIAASGILHARFEMPVRSRIVSRFARR